MEIYPIFTDVMFKIDQLNIDNLKLADECVFVSNDLKSRSVSNKGGYQSPNIHQKYCIENDLTEFLKLTEEIQSALNNVAKNFNGGELVLGNIWININENNNYNEKHTHPRSIISGSYYVDVPDQLGGEFVLYRDRSFGDYAIEPWIEDKSNYDFFKHSMVSTGYKTKPETGNLIMFFSNLEHSVEPITTPSKRISISFNSSCRPEFWIN